MPAVCPLPDPPCGGARGTRMPRSNLDRKKVPAPDERPAARYLLELPGDRLYREPLAFPWVSSASLFVDDTPMVMEIGCGTGDFLCSCARSSASIGSSAPVSYKKCTPPRHLREGSAL